MSYRKAPGEKLGTGERHINLLARSTYGSAEDRQAGIAGSTSQVKMSLSSHENKYDSVAWMTMRPRGQPGQPLTDDPHPTPVDSSYDSCAGVPRAEMK